MENRGQAVRSGDTSLDATKLELMHLPSFMRKGHLHPSSFLHMGLSLPFICLISQDLKLESFS